MNCSTGKIQHKDQASAERHALAIQKKDGHLPHIYTCGECGFLHIGGGRKSDRPAWVQPANIPVLPPDPHTGPRKEYERRKIDKGQQLTIEDLILEQLASGSFKTDLMIAKEVSCERTKVTKMREELGIATAHERATAKMRLMLEQNPAVSRKLLQSSVAPLGESFVEDAVKKLGYAGKGKKGTSGANNAMFGRKLSAERRQALSDWQKAEWERNPNRTTHVFSDEDREKAKATNRTEHKRMQRSYISKKMWRVHRDKMVAGLIMSHNTPEYLEAKRIEATLYHLEHPEHAEQAREQMLKNWENPAFRAKQQVTARKRMKQANDIRWTDPAQREAVSQQTKQRWADPEFKARMSAKMKAVWEKRKANG